MLIDQALSGRLTRREALKRALALGLSGPLVSLILAACGTGTPTATKSSATGAAGTAKKGGTIKAGLDSDVANLDPMRSSLLVDRQVLYNIYDSLVTYDDKLTIQPSLAERWETPDTKTYIFHLRQGVKFHDGTDFNAEAVKFNIERNLNDKNTKRKSELDTITSVEVVDANTVKFNLKSPFSPLLANLVDRAGMMVSPKAAQAGGEDFTRKPVDAGTGPFKFVEWVTSDHITLTRNESYWRKDAAGTALPYLDKVTYRPITDETVSLTNLKTGDLDIGFVVPAKDYAGLKSGGELLLSEMPGLGFASFELNTQSEPFNKKELRQAIAEAVDRDQLLKTVFFGIGQAAYGPIPPPSWAFDTAFKPYGANADKAKEYLKTGGKADGFTFEMKVSAGSPTTTQLAQLLKDQLAKANITMNITQLEFTKIVDDQQKGNFQGTLVGWSGRIDPDGNIYNQFRTGGSLNDPKYSNKAVDDLLDQARAEGEQAKRKDLYQQVQKLIGEDASFVFYRFNPAFMLARPSVQGMQLYPDQIMRFATGWLK